MQTDISYDYQVGIIGGGVIGTSALYTIAKYTNVDRLILVERFNGFGLVNSSDQNNSQTLHAGDIETNYSLEKAREVKFAADLLAWFLESHANHCFTKQGKMVIAFGDQEVAELESRFIEFSPLYPDLRRIEAAEIAQYAPKIMEGRDPNQAVLALYTPNGYTVNYRLLSQQFAKMAKETGKDVTFRMNCKIVKIERYHEGYQLIAEDGTVTTLRTLILAAGPHSLMFAKQLGIAEHIGVLPVAGNYYQVAGKSLITVKAYRVQKKKLPFAAVHADPEFSDPSTVRIGPTAQILGMLIRHKYDTVGDFITTSVWTLRGMKVLLGIVADKILFPYMLKNMMYLIPFIGKRLFLNWEARELFPTLCIEDLEECPGKGGVRPQPVNTKTGEMGMDAHFEGKNLLVEITPSPGATKCLDTAFKIARRIVPFIGGEATFYDGKYQDDFGTIKKTA